VYAYVRGAKQDGGLAVAMHGLENLGLFEGGLGRGKAEELRPEEERGRTIGMEVGVIYEAIRDGRMRGVLVGMFEGV
ncbi:hypothetical protein EW145_g3084, partial [Phellinidium pouzarii]